MRIATDESESSTLKNTVQAAKFLGVSKAVMIRWRSERRGPTYVRFAPNLVRYKISDLIEFLEKHLVHRPLTGNDAPDASQGANQ